MTLLDIAGELDELGGVVRVAKDRLTSRYTVGDVARPAHDLDSRLSTHRETALATAYLYFLGPRAFAHS